jgi:hypothetical protein
LNAAVSQARNQYNTLVAKMETLKPDHSDQEPSEIYNATVAERDQVSLELQQQYQQLVYYEASVAMDFGPEHVYQSLYFSDCLAQDKGGYVLLSPS